MATETILKCGEQLDVYSDQDKGWLIATIVATNQLSIKIHYLAWNSKWDRWLWKDSKNIAPLNTHTVPVIHLSPPNKLCFCTANIFTDIDKKLIIYPTMNSIYKYDMVNDKHSKINDMYIVPDAVAAYDNINGLLYFVNPHSNSLYMAAAADGILTYLGDVPWMSSIRQLLIANGSKNTQNALHMFTDRNHGYYSQDGTSYAGITTHNAWDLNHTKMIYSP